MFEDYLETRNDAINNAAYALAESLVRDSELEWNMSYIGEIVDAAESILMSKGFKTCHPFYEGADICPCVEGQDCDRAHCPAMNPANKGVVRGGTYA